MGNVPIHLLILREMMLTTEVSY